MLTETKSAPAVAASPRLLVSLATYDEALNLRPLVETIREFAPDAAILVIDDNSPDGTGDVADQIRDMLPNIHVIHRSGKLGLGTAVLTGMKFAIDNGYDYFLNLDADFSHPPRFIPEILRKMKDNDVVIGSRYVPGGGVEGEFNLRRKFMSTGINMYARMFLGLRNPRQQWFLSLLPGLEAAPDRFEPGPVRAGIRSWKRSCIGVEA